MSQLEDKRRPFLGATIACSLGAAGLLLGACGGGGAKNAGAPSATHTHSTKAPATTSAAPKAPATTATPAVGQGGGPGGNAAAQAQSVKFAHCVRAHGVPNFPDNAITITPQGGVLFHLGANSGINTQSPQFQSAMQACRADLPHGAAGGALPPSHSRKC